jgi:hypothetical protein
VFPVVSSTLGHYRVSVGLARALRKLGYEVAITPINPFRIQPERDNLAGTPSADFWVGAVEPTKCANAQQSGTDLPQTPFVHLEF